MAAPAEHSFIWGGRSLSFALQRADVQRLRIAVHPDGSIAVTAPLQADEMAVIARVQRRGHWIANQLDRFARWQPRTPPRVYASGETHMFQGRQYRLKIKAGSPAGVVVDGDRLVVGLPDAQQSWKVERLVRDWFAEQGKRILRERFEIECERWQRHGVLTPSRLIVRALVNRWGSMTKSGSLVLNSDLVHASPRLIDYVIAHEVAHVRFPDHGSEWRTILSSVMPDWRERKHQLEIQLL